MKTSGGGVETGPAWRGAVKWSTLLSTGSGWVETQLPLDEEWR